MISGQASGSGNVNTGLETNLNLGLDNTAGLDDWINE